MYVFLFLFWDMFLNWRDEDLGAARFKFALRVSNIWSSFFMFQASVYADVLQAVGLRPF